MSKEELRYKGESLREVGETEFRKAVQGHGICGGALKGEELYPATVYGGFDNRLLGLISYKEESNRKFLLPV